jgi:acyl carrier protein
MTNNVLPKIQEAFRDAFGVEVGSITIETRPEDVTGWDSLGHVNLASCLEKAFGISLDVDDMMEMEDVRKLVGVIEKKLGTN